MPGKVFPPWLVLLLAAWLAPGVCAQTVAADEQGNLFCTDAVGKRTQLTAKRERFACDGNDLARGKPASGFVCWRGSAADAHQFDAHLEHIALAAETGVRFAGAVDGRLVASVKPVTGCLDAQAAGRGTVKTVR